MKLGPTRPFRGRGDKRKEKKWLKEQSKKEKAKEKEDDADADEFEDDWKELKKEKRTTKRAKIWGDQGLVSRGFFWSEFVSDFNKLISSPAVIGVDGQIPKQVPCIGFLRCSFGGHGS